MAAEIYVAVKTIRELIKHNSPCSVAKTVMEQTYTKEKEDLLAILSSSENCMWCDLVRSAVLQDLGN